MAKELSFLLEFDFFLCQRSVIEPKKKIPTNYYSSRVGLF